MIDFYSTKRLRALMNVPLASGFRRLFTCLLLFTFGTDAFNISVFAREISYWKQSNTANHWHAALAMEESWWQGYAINVASGGGWTFRGENKADLDETAEIPGVYEKWLLPSPWWLTPSWQLGALETGESLGITLNAERNRLDLALRNERISFKRIADQRHKETEEFIPNPWKEDPLITLPEQIPLRVRWYEIHFRDPFFAPLETMIADIVGQKKSDFLESAPTRLKERVSLYFEQDIVLALSEYTRRRVVFLVYDIRRAWLSSSDVAVDSICFEKRAGEWVETDLKPNNLDRLRPKRISRGPGNELGNGLDQPDLLPSAWLPGNIGLWNPGYQDSGAAGVVAAKFIKSGRSKTKPLRNLPFTTPTK